MLSINSNNSASMATYAMRQANAAESNASRRLASGYRVNSAADDAAGKAVVTKLTRAIQGVNLPYVILQTCIVRSALWIIPMHL